MTRGASAAIPKQPKLLDRLCVYQTDPTKVTGHVTSPGFYNPLFRWTQ